MFAIDIYTASDPKRLLVDDQYSMDQLKGKGGVKFFRLKNYTNKRLTDLMKNNTKKNNDPKDKK